MALLSPRLSDLQPSAAPVESTTGWMLYSSVFPYNQRRPHQGISQQCPIPRAHVPGHGPIARHDVLGGIIHDYERQESA
jgi:hypothetical protein